MNRDLSVTVPDVRISKAEEPAYDQSFHLL